MCFLLPTFKITNAQIIIHFKIMNILPVATVSLLLGFSVLVQRPVHVALTGINDEHVSCIEKSSHECSVTCSVRHFDPLESRIRFKREAKRPGVTRNNDGFNDCYDKCIKKWYERCVDGFRPHKESRRSINREAKSHGKELTF